MDINVSSHRYRARPSRRQSRRKGLEPYIPEDA
jgi:hypothetical protein